LKEQDNKTHLSEIFPLPLRLRGERGKPFRKGETDMGNDSDNGAGSYRRFLSGDDDGLAAIVNEYREGLILYLQSLVANLYMAEELAEETFFRLMVKKPRFSGKSSFKSWLYAIGRHVAIDHLRRNAKLADTRVEDMAEYLADETDLERAYIRSEQRIRLHRAMEKLIPDYRQVLWLVYFEELSHEEVGTVMKKNSRQITNLLYRAKQSLRTELEKEGFSDEEF